MPFTYNGVGTTYYGKKNLQQRPGACRQCGRNATLSSYDTKLWFVIFFIPVIPLGRKHIIDQCSACRRHYVADAQKWETAKQLETSGAMESFRNDATPEKAIAAHQQLLGFHQIEEAVEFQKTMEQKFADNAKVHVYLGEALSHLGKLDQAMPCFERALNLRPDLPEARAGVARARIREGKLDEARQLLTFLEAAGAAQLYSLAPLEILANAFQKANRHQEALVLFKCILDGLPSVAQHHAFRKAVKKSEKALGVGDSILPKAKFSLRGIFKATNAGGPVPALRFAIIASIIAAIVGIGFVWSNEYIRRHRTLHIINGFDTPVQGTITGVGPFSARQGGMVSIVLPEGHYRARVTAPIQQDIDFEVRSSYTDRWFQKPAWVLNPGGAGILVWQEAVYSVNRDERGRFKYYYGKPFQYFPDISCPFTPLPKQISVSSSAPRQVRTHLAQFPGSAINAFYALSSDHRNAEASDLAQWYLGSNDDPEMIEAWLQADTNQLSTIVGFLSAHLSDRPVRMELHRTYQTITGKTRPQLRAQYDAMIAAEPQNSALFYLRGRICEEKSEGREYFHKALTIDANNAYAMYALAYDEITMERWDRAKALLDKCVALQPRNKGFTRQWEVASLALSDFDGLEKHLRERCHREPANVDDAWHLCEALIAQGKTQQTEGVITEFEKACRVRFKRPVPEAGSIVRSRVLYATGDFAALEAFCTNDRSGANGIAKLWALVEQGKLEEAIKSYPGKNVGDPYFLLTVSIAADLAGKTADAERWRAQAIGLMTRPEEENVVQLLTSPDNVSKQAVENLNLPLDGKAIVLASLAMTHPQQRAELAAAARNVNVERIFPYHVIRRATANL